MYENVTHGPTQGTKSTEGVRASAENKVPKTLLLRVEKLGKWLFIVAGDMSAMDKIKINEV